MWIREGAALVTVGEHDEAPDVGCQCAICGEDRAFELPEQLVDACAKGQLVVFAGGGVTTESKAVYPWTLYEDVASSLGLGKGTSLTFAQVMSLYSEQKGRAALLRVIRERLLYVEAFPTLRLVACQFHRELSTIPCLTNIVTTNWDTFFEDECSAIPIVVPEDYAFWDLPDRKVFKIHGSMNNLSTIVATSEDYKKCYQRLRSGLIGGSLKHLLATKTIVFIGYSLRDEDFLGVYRFLKKEMSDILPRSFVVSTNPDTELPWAGVSLIHTSGAHFVRELKRSLVERGVMLPDSIFDGVLQLRARIGDAHTALHEVFPPSRYPAAIYSASYQDGLLDACNRIMARAKSGEYSDEGHVNHIIHSYEHLRKGALQDKKYFDVPYIEGYQNGMLYLLLPPRVRKALPLFYMFGCPEELRSISRLRKWMPRARTLHKTSYAYAEKVTRRIGDLEAQHTPFLMGIRPV